MEQVYQKEYSKYGYPTIIIRRKPSQIPASIDLKLMQLAGAGNIDGPNSLCAYEFFDLERFLDAEEFLVECGWKKEEKT